MSPPAAGYWIEINCDAWRGRVWVPQLSFRAGTTETLDEPARRWNWSLTAHRDTPPARVSSLEVSRLRDIEGDRKVNRSQSGRAESPRLARLDRTPVRLRGYGRVVAILPWLIAGEWVLSPANRN